MKKFVKVSLVTAGVLAVVGCMLCLVSAIGGGRNVIAYANEENVLGNWGAKGGVIARKLLRLAGHDIAPDLPGIDEIALDQEGGTGERVHVSGDDTGMSAAEKHIDTKEVKNLCLMLGAGTFTVSEKTAGEGETLDLYIQGEGSCDFYVKKETLYVEGFKGHHILGSDFNSNNITLKVPMGMRFDEVEAEVGAGIMEFYDIEARELEASVGAGVLNLYRSQAEELSAEIGAGEFYAQDMTSQKADLTVSLGTCTYQGAIARELEAECDMGNMDFLLKGKEEDYNYEIECSGGNIEMDSFNTAAFAMERRIDNGAATTFDLSCSMGNITIHFEE